MDGEAPPKPRLMPKPKAKPKPDDAPEQDKDRDKQPKKPLVTPSAGFQQAQKDGGSGAGRLLMFPPYWMFQHVGNAPVSNDKYILSTYLLFDKPGSPEHTHE